MPEGRYSQAGSHNGHHHGWCKVALRGRGKVSASKVAAPNSGRPKLFDELFEATARPIGNGQLWAKPNQTAGGLDALREIPVFTADDRLVVSANASQCIRAKNAEVCRLGLAGRAADVIGRTADAKPTGIGPGDRLLKSAASASEHDAAEFVCTGFGQQFDAALDVAGG